MGHLSFLIFKFYEGYHNICILAYIQVNSSVFGEGSHRTPKVMTQFSDKEREREEGRNVQIYFNTFYFWVETKQVAKLLIACRG